MTMGFDTGLEEGQEGNGGEVDGRDIGVEGFRPLGEVLVVPELFFELGGLGGVGLDFWARYPRCRDYDRRCQMEGLTEAEINYIN